MRWLTPFRDDLVGIREAIVWHYLLLEDDGGVIALDAGLGLAAGRIRRWFAATGRKPTDLKAIVLTHGHLDHAGCAERLRRWSDGAANVYLHPADEAIVRGRHPYRGWNRLVGWSEAIGRPLVGYRQPQQLQPLVDQQELPFWGGMRTIHLPGHTPGHVGFHCLAKSVLFAGDAILSRGPRCFFPFYPMNCNHAQVRPSVLRLADLDVDFVYPSHHRNLKHNLMQDIRQFAARAGG